MTSEAPDGPLDTPDDADAVRRTQCATCRAVIDPTRWHPVSARVDDDGEFHLYVFCCTDCRDEHGSD